MFSVNEAQGFKGDQWEKRLGTAGFKDEETLETTVFRASVSHFPVGAGAVESSLSAAG